MAACIDCGEAAKFLSKRCANCQEKHNQEVEKQRAADAEVARKLEFERSISGEADALASAKSGLSYTFDKFENRHEIDGPIFKSNRTDFKAAAVVIDGEACFWLIGYHKVPDWIWLNDNRTILLLESGARFVLDHGLLKDTQVGTDWADNVVCAEEHHIDFTSFVPEIVKIYEEASQTGKQSELEVKIGSQQYTLGMDFLRTVTAIDLLIKEKEGEK
jgi:hypothetical protein